jgi:hypothetical protein
VLLTLVALLLVLPASALARPTRLLAAFSGSGVYDRHYEAHGVVQDTHKDFEWDYKFLATGRKGLTFSKPRGQVNGEVTRTGYLNCTATYSSLTPEGSVTELRRKGGYRRFEVTPVFQMEPIGDNAGDCSIETLQSGGEIVKVRPRRVRAGLKLPVKYRSDFTTEFSSGTQTWSGTLKFSKP